MLVRDCMTKQVELGNPNITLSEAAKKMKDGDFGMLPIADNDRLVGMVTDRDIAIRAVAEGKDPKQLSVRDIMTENVLYCYEDQTLDEIAENFGSNQIRRLPVLNRQKRLVGILSMGDLAKSNVSSQKVEEALYNISKNSKDQSQSAQV